MCEEVGLTKLVVIDTFGQYKNAIPETNVHYVPNSPFTQMSEVNIEGIGNLAEINPDIVIANEPPTAVGLLSDYSAILGGRDKGQTLVWCGYFNPAEVVTMEERDPLDTSAHNLAEIGIGNVWRHIQPIIKYLLTNIFENIKTWTVRPSSDIMTKTEILKRGLSSLENKKTKLQKMKNKLDKYKKRLTNEASQNQEMEWLYSNYKPAEGRERLEAQHLNAKISMLEGEIQRSEMKIKKTWSEILEGLIKYKVYPRDLS